MDERLTLNNGTVLENSHVLESSGCLFVYIQSGNSMREVFDLLDEPENTKKIVESRSGTERSFKGYKRLTSVSDEGGGLISAVLKKA